QRVTTQVRAPVMVGGEPSRIGRVDRDGEAAFGEKTAGRLEDFRGACTAMAVAQDDVGPGSSTTGAGPGGHRMAIDQQTAAKQTFGLLDEPAQNPMIWPIKLFDALLRLGKAELLRVYFLAAGDQSGDRAEAHSNAWRSGVDELWKCVTEHARIEFVGFAIDIGVRPPKTDRQQVCPETRRSGKQPVE